MKKMRAFIGLFLLLLAGCQMNQDVRPKDIDPEDLPDVPAFQDEATREFLVSTEEVEPGLYLIESKLQGFQMLFPEEGIYSKSLSTIENQGKFEMFTYEEFSDDRELQVGGKIRYRLHQSYLPNPDFELDRIRRRTDFQGEFNLKETSDKKIYFGEEMKTVEADSNEQEVNNFYGYIESKGKDFLTVEYYFFIFCFNDDKDICLKKVDEKKEQIQKIIDSITFIYQEEADRDE
ncbi:hypothetical protein [Amphibacillus jilinensis]|uniref:hypothetical protein n=1 Tax=Amphibacillus jilinensis TaxID=1216008 RepID=UPI0002E76B93|nr:hypothetical protein [Amphibacillus jilinensis]